MAPYWRFDTDDMVFASTLIWYHTQTNTHRAYRDQQTDTNRYKYILTPSVMCTQQLPVLHWMNNLLIQRFILQSSKMSLLFKNCSFVEFIYLLIRFNITKSFLWNTKNADRNGVNRKTYTTHRKKGNFRKG